MLHKEAWGSVAHLLVQVYNNQTSILSIFSFMLCGSSFLLQPHIVEIKDIQFISNQKLLDVQELCLTGLVCKISECGDQSSDDDEDSWNEFYGLFVCLKLIKKI